MYTHTKRIQWGRVAGGKQGRMQWGRVSKRKEGDIAMEKEEGEWTRQ